MSKHAILFLAANPAGLTPRRLDEEAREIEDEVRRASRRDAFELVSRVAARPIDLLRALREVRPTIVHFAGHTHAGGIYLLGPTGEPAPVTREALHETFGAAGASVRIAVLNGCATEDLAATLSGVLPVCVGTSASFGDSAARAFSIGFYGALASSEPVARAFRHGKAAIHLEATGDHDRPRLHHRGDVDPDTLVLVDGAAPSRESRGEGIATPASTVPDGNASFARAVATTRNGNGTDLIAPVVLVQLSDLHFGPHSRFAGLDLGALAAQCRHSLDEARADLGWSERISLVVVTGDIAEAARPPEYADATAFFTALAEHLALSPHRFVFVPGNHDVSWTRCSAVMGQLSDGEFPASELRARLDAVKLAHFERFIHDVHGGKPRHEVDGSSVTALGRSAFIHDFADLGVAVAALNSCERESHRSEDHIGEVTSAQAQAVLDHWRAAPSERLRIVAVHHNPDAMASPAIEQWLAFLRTPDVTARLPPELVDRIATNFVGFEGRDELRGMASDSHVALLLHGHHHASTSHQAWAWRGRDAGGHGDTRILSAGSWGLTPESGKLPNEQPVVMQLVRLDPAAAQLHAVLLTWDPNARMPGSVQRGRFALDSASRAERPIGLSLPPSLRGRFRASDPTTTLAPPQYPRAPELSAVIERYRARKRRAFERWDLRTAGPQPTLGNRPTEITLDEMYIPLRFGPAFDPGELNRGEPIEPDELLRPRRPQVVIGSAGSGKTTWMKWIFRRLIQESRALPFFLELRAIAAGWTTAQDAARSIESHLAAALDECGARDASAIVRDLLDDTTGPHPVILIDGWDELGAEGERMRERLVELCQAYPHVAIVVSSRPFGETRPSSAEAFETIHIQPLSDEEIRLLATRFHRRIHGSDESAASRVTEELMAALEATPEAQSLARTVLLLTMMLLLSREGPLPDRRHKLYAACLRSMLVHRVSQREADGVLIDADRQWRPDDSEERLRVVAELAYRMQTEGYMLSRRAPMVRHWGDAIELFGSDWALDQRARFLRWLIETAGVLTDRTDGSVQFVHLSFQEHLAAYYLFISREGDERVTAVRAHMYGQAWWETLRLWAGLIGDHWPDKLAPALKMLRADPNTYWLAGQMFADGTGRPADFEPWVSELSAHLSDLFAEPERCALAWRASKQEQRRTLVARELTAAREQLRWLDGSWHASWCQLAGLKVDLAPAVLALEAPMSNPAAVARSRVLHGAAAAWPDSGELAALRIWPSVRVAVGTRLQSAISLGAQRSDITAMFVSLIALAHRTWTTEDRTETMELCDNFDQYFVKTLTRAFGRSFVRDFGHDFARSFVWHLGWKFVRDFGRFFVRDFIQVFGQDFSQHFSRAFHSNLAQDLVRDFDQYFIRGFGRYFVRDFGRDFGRYFRGDFDQKRVLYHVRSFEHALTQVLGLSQITSTTRWWRAFAIVDLVSMLGRALPRAMWASKHVPDHLPLTPLFRAACRASFSPADTQLRDSVERGCEQFMGAPMWRALARHVARISTLEDRALLTDLVRHPELCEPPLSWGLQHYVRGDLVFDDGSVVSLDRLCADVGLSPLPLLEDMPDELDIRFDI